MKELQIEQDFAVLGESMESNDDNATDIYHALEVVFDKMSKDEFNTINKVNEGTLEYFKLRVVQKLNNEFKTHGTE